MAKFEDLVNKKFGRLLVTGYHGRRGAKSKWNCVCDCGSPAIVFANCLKSGMTKSCGCIRKERAQTIKLSHGMAESKEFNAWMHAKSRCSNPNNIGFKHYGGRGIAVCEKWAKDFSAFFADMGPCPPGMSIERVDVNGNYEPGNCKWATQAEQTLNTRRTRWIECNGQRKPLAVWAREIGATQQNLRSRLKNGYSLKEIVENGMNFIKPRRG